MKKLMTVIAVALFAVGCSTAKNNVTPAPAGKAAVAPARAKTTTVMPVKTIPPQKRIDY